MDKDRIKTGRDPFARQTIVKRSVTGTCTWCGQCNRYGMVWIYSVERDGYLGSKTDFTGTFCSVDCLNSYHR